MGSSVMDEKVDETNDGATSRLTKYWVDEPQGSTVSI